MFRTALVFIAAAALGACASVDVAAPAANAGTPQQRWEAGQRAFLAGNALRPGWTVLDDGLQLRRVSKRGAGPRPAPDDTVTIHYVGTLTNGAEFDSSRRRNEPATFPLPDLIKGWQEGVPLMRKGETWEFVIPAAMAYGSRAVDIIPANSTLLFSIELIDFED